MASPSGNPRPESGRLTATWVLAALLGMATIGTLPSAAPITSSSARAGRDAPPPADETRLRALRAGEGLSGLVGLPPAPRPAPAEELRPAEFTTNLPDDRARIAVDTAMAQLGLPYQWGGNGPAAGDPGFDCSGLTTFAYAAAGITLPRTAHTQYYAGPHVSDGAALQPGDLVFYGTAAKVHHVGMYIGEGRMVNAPTFGTPVRTSYYRWRGDDYLGATRPAATGEPSTGLLPYVAPLAPPLISASPPAFEAPPAPLPPGPLPQPSDSLPPEPVTAAAAIAASDLPAELSATDTGPPVGGETPGLVGPGAGDLPPGVATPSAPDGATPPDGAGIGPAAGQGAGFVGPPGVGTPDVPEPRAPAAGPSAGEPTPSAAPVPDTAPVAAFSAESPSAGRSTAAAGPGSVAGSAPAAGPGSAAGSAPAAGPGSAAAPASGSEPSTGPGAAPDPAAPRDPAATPAPPVPRELTLPGGPVALTPVEQRASGVPALPAAGGGVWTDGGCTVITLDSPTVVDTAGPGTSITVGYRDGTTQSFTVRYRATMTTAEAARLLADAPAGQLLVLAQAGPDSWVVLTAS
nr:NlpC/P60 family protein [Pseudonocardia bannensis]